MSERFVELHRLQRRHGALDTVQFDRRAEFQSPHIPDVGEIVLHAGGRPGHSRVRHRHTAGNKPCEHGLHRRLIALQKALGMVDAGLQRVADQLRDPLAVILAGDDVCNAPLGDADIFGQHVAQTGLEHMQRRIFQNIHVADDHVGAARRQ